MIFRSNFEDKIIELEKKLENSLELGKILEKVRKKGDFLLSKEERMLYKLYNKLKIYYDLYQEEKDAVYEEYRKRGWLIIDFDPVYTGNKYDKISFIPSGIFLFSPLYLNLKYENPRWSYADFSYDDNTLSPDLWAFIEWLSFIPKSHFIFFPNEIIRNLREEWRDL